MKTDHFEMKGIRGLASFSGILLKGGSDGESTQDGQGSCNSCPQAARLVESKIARELGIHRTTVAEYLKPKPTKVPIGSGEQEEPDNERSRSGCEAYRDVILAKLDQGVSAQRIFQDLVSEGGFPQGYNGVKRYVRQLTNG